MHTLLVANRGEITRRIFRTAREMGLRTVAVFSEPDAGAPFAREADVAVALGGATPAESYLRVDAVIDAARRAGADAIHPGYGFLSESAEFAAAVLEAGLTWVGPPPEVIAAMGSKLEAKKRMRDAGVPTLDDPSGFPRLVKASAGGGGKGMRIVRSPEELAGAREAAEREAVSAFGDGTLFEERYVERARHVEVQVMGDAHGDVIALLERECSIQRRHQKIVEESPSPGIDAATREAMVRAAVDGCRAIGYVSAGTVEFIVDVDTSEFFFLEVNTRLQVEHPVTELVTGLDLVRLQLEVAEGAHVGSLEVASRGHAIEARLYAEDPANGFLPVVGTLERFGFDASVRVDTGVEDGSEISPYYDPMLAKVIASGPTRAEAARRLARALRGAELHGMRTNRELLVRVLEHPEFLDGTTDTAFLERNDPAVLGAPLLSGEDEALAAAAAALADQAARRAGAAVLGAMPSGWRNNASQDQLVSFAGPGDEPLEVAYRFARDGSLAALRVGDREIAGARLHACAPDAVELEAGGVRRSYVIARSGDRRWVNVADGQADLVVLPRFPSSEESAPAGSLVSPMPGAVLRVGAEVGDRVEAGAVLVVIEAMKMEQEVLAPAAGEVAEVRVAPGAQVSAGDVLIVIEPA